jgi:hypothetical protein
MEERSGAIERIRPRGAGTVARKPWRILAASLLPTLASLLLAFQLRNRPLEMPFSSELGTHGSPLVGFVGFSSAEPWGRWSQADEARIVLPGRLPRDFDLVLEARAYGPNIGAPAELSAGAVAAQFTLAETLEKRVLRFRNVPPTDALSFRIPRPASPREGGEGDDSRRLGIGVARLALLEPSREE